MKKTAKFLAQTEIKRIERKNGVTFLKEIRSRVFEKLKEIGLVENFVFYGENIYCVVSGIHNRKLKIKLCFLIEKTIPLKEVFSSSMYVKVLISLSVKESDLFNYFKKIIESKIRGFANENSFEKDVLPEIRKIHRVSHANRLSERADALQGIDFEIEYYVDRYYTQTITLLINVKSSDKYLQKNIEKYPDVYNFVYKKGDPLNSTVYRIKRMMVARKTLG